MSPGTDVLALVRGEIRLLRMSVNYGLLEGKSCQLMSTSGGEHPSASDNRVLRMSAVFVVPVRRQNDTDRQVLEKGGKRKW